MYEIEINPLISKGTTETKHPISGLTEQNVDDQKMYEQAKRNLLKNK